MTKRTPASKPSKPRTRKSALKQTPAGYTTPDAPPEGAPAPKPLRDEDGRATGTVADLCRAWVAAIKSLRQAHRDLDAFGTALAFTAFDAAESLEKTCDPSLDELGNEAVPAILWQLKHALHEIHNGVPAGVDYLLGRFAKGAGETDLQAFVREKLAETALEQLGESAAE